MSRPGQSESQLFDLEWELLLTARKWPQLAHRIGGVNVIDLAKVQSLGDLPATHQTVLLALLLAVKDRATELRFEPWRYEGEDGNQGQEQPSVRLFYEVDGQLHELVPPPTLLAPFLFREIGTIAGLNTLRGRLANLLRRLASRIDRQILPPRQSGFRLYVIPYATDIEVLFCPSAWGDRLFLRLPVMPADLAEIAGADGRLLAPYSHLLRE